MNTIKIKIKDVDVNNKTILVSTASDETNSNNPDDYEPLAFQPLMMWPDENDVNKIIRNLAYANLHTAEQKKIQESITEEDERIQWLKSINGKTFEFNVQELIDSYNK